MGLDEKKEEPTKEVKPTYKSTTRNAKKNQMKATKFQPGPDKQNLSMVHTMVMDMLRNQQFQKQSLGN